MNKIHQNENSVSRQIETLLYKKYPNKKSKLQEQRKELFQCMDSNGYILHKESSGESSEDEYYQEKVDSSSDEEEQFVPYEQEFRQSLVEREQSSISGPFAQRTTIQGSERLSNLNLRGITSEEQDYLLVQEQVDNVLNKLQLDNMNEIKKYAMDMYLRIKEFYKTSNEIKGEIKGSVRLGYILLIVYYALINFRICISKPELVVYFDNKVSLSDLPKADKNIKIIFGNLDNHELCLCNMRSLFDTFTLQKIHTTLQQLKDAGKINDPATIVQIAAVIHYVTKIDYSVIKNYCGVSPDTIRKTYFMIRQSLI
jgi:hypothetical protein